MTTATAINLNRFIGRAQTRALDACLRGEEGEYFRTMLCELRERIEAMPTTYQTDGQGDDAIVSLHYFTGGSDWWILERDQEEDQEQAFGFACLNGDAQNAELGYIPIMELIRLNVELDLYWTPKPLREIKAKLGC